MFRANSMHISKDVVFKLPFGEPGCELLLCWLQVTYSDFRRQLQTPLMHSSHKFTSDLFISVKQIKLSVIMSEYLNCSSSCFLLGRLWVSFQSWPPRWKNKQTNKQNQLIVITNAFTSDGVFPFCMGGSAFREGVLSQSLCPSVRSML